MIEPTDDDDVIKAIAACNTPNGPTEENTPTKVFSSVQLTSDQKTLIIRYVLGSIGKGVFEDVPAFWEGIPEDKIDELYSSYREAAQKFVDELREYAETLV